jgi:hypothetical protein
MVGDRQRAAEVTGPNLIPAIRYLGVAGRAGLRGRARRNRCESYGCESYGADGYTSHEKLPQ